jgi:uncharacterized protein (UPF0276 family)
MRDKYPVYGAGLGLRRTLLDSLASLPSGAVDFMEIAPENWIGLGGRYGKVFKELTEKNHFVAHGLSLSLGGPDPIDIDFVKSVKQFLKEHNISLYSEHLSYCSDGGHLYDLMPIPFTQESVSHVAGRIRQVQDILEQKIAIENVSAYASPGQEMLEIDFLNAVLNEADCDMLLDVNNIYVNSVNHSYDPQNFLRQIQGDRVAYIHIAGHYEEAEDLLVDTHGADVKNVVWGLLDQTYNQFGVIPTLLERDFNFPPINELLTEVEQIKSMQQKYCDSENNVAIKHAAKVDHVRS